MPFQKKVHIIYFFLVTVILFLQIEFACTKEYSYERKDIHQDTTMIIDTTKVHDTATAFPLVFPYCSTCDSTAPLTPAKWNFRINNSFVCGNLTNALMNIEKDAFTFFGPSACSVDSGIVVTAYFPPEAFVNDAVNITTNRVHFEYYDNTVMYDLLESKKPYVFSLTIDSFSTQTKRAKGHFNGYVVGKNGAVNYIKQGNFNLRFQ